MTQEEINNENLKRHLKTALQDLKNKNLVRDFSLCNDGSFLVKPNYAVEPKKEQKLTLTDLINEQKTTGYLTCDMVDWAQAEINSSGPLKQKCLAILALTFENSSPMWRQSHYGLKDYLLSHGIAAE